MGDGEKLLGRLRRAREDRALVRVHRRRHLVAHEGYVVAVGQRWVLLAVLDPMIVLDGFTALRLRDVRGVERRRSAGFVSAALVLRGRWPPAAPPSPVDLDSTRALLGSVGDAWPLVSVHPELDDPEVCSIGEVQRVGAKTLRLREIAPDATWQEPGQAQGTYRLGRITRVDVGGSYEQALVDVAASAEGSPRRRADR